MARALQYAGGVAAIVQRDFSLFVSYRFTVVTQTLTVLFTLTIFYYVSRLVTIGEFESPDDYYAYVVVGILTLEVVSSVLILMPTTVRQELIAGTFERLVLSPFGAIASVASMALFPLLWSVVRASLMVAFATLIFDLPLQGPEALLAIPTAALISMSFVPFGLMLAGLILLVKQSLGAGTWIVAAITLVAGFYFPVSLLPDWIRWVSEVQPFTPAVELMRYLIVGTEMSQPAWSAVFQLILFTAVLLPVSLWVIARAIRIGRRRGTIIEY